LHDIIYRWTSRKKQKKIRLTEGKALENEEKEAKKLRKQKKFIKMRTR
jgi:hypothetical protein